MTTDVHNVVYPIHVTSKDSLLHRANASLDAICYRQKCQALIRTYKAIDRLLVIDDLLLFQS